MILYVRRIVCTRNGSCFHKSLGVSYSTIRDDFRKYILPFMSSVDVYIALNQVVPPLTKLSDAELKDKHAGWEKSQHKVVLH